MAENQKESSRKGIIQASLHIVESEMKLSESNPAKAITICLNMLSHDDQAKAAERFTSFLKEQEMLMNKKAE